MDKIGKAKQRYDQWDFSELLDELQNRFNITPVIGPDAAKLTRECQEMINIHRWIGETEDGRSAVIQLLAEHDVELLPLLVECQGGEA